MKKIILCVTSWLLISVCFRAGAGTDENLGASAQKDKQKVLTSIDSYKENAAKTVKLKDCTILIDQDFWNATDWKTTGEVAGYLFKMTNVSGGAAEAYAYGIILRTYFLLHKDSYCRGKGWDQLYKEGVNSVKNDFAWPEKIPAQ